MPNRAGSTSGPLLGLPAGGPLVLQALRLPQLRGLPDVDCRIWTLGCHVRKPDLPYEEGSKPTSRVAPWRRPPNRKATLWPACHIRKARSRPRSPGRLPICPRSCLVTCPPVQLSQRQEGKLAVDLPHRSLARPAEKGGPYRPRRRSPATPAHQDGCEGGLLRALPRARITEGGAAPRRLSRAPPVRRPPNATRGHAPSPSACLTACPRACLPACLPPCPPACLPACLRCSAAQPDTTGRPPGPTCQVRKA